MSSVVVKETDVRPKRPIISPPTEFGLYVLSRKYPRSRRFPIAAWVPPVKLEQASNSGVLTTCTNCQLPGHTEALCVETGSRPLWLKTCDEPISLSSIEDSHKACQEYLSKDAKSESVEKRGCMLLLNNVLNTEKCKHDPQSAIRGSHSITSGSEDGEEFRRASSTPQSVLTSPQCTGASLKEVRGKWTTPVETKEVIPMDTEIAKPLPRMMYLHL
eukprot:CAMPEP_0118932772 /NCGR_PEP_ID=MMETSP1169-20130426/10613_1 /TAXON_ID=36882 /ORGANISM="Pyramimonas obovata, Strain CCMP722" /LENGTH=215 /DNA_ID=CAMNT_0006875473 /DNA_START=188 /DNA_END=835 /DNA_ORIENTATION=-